jgi:recombination protein RecR
MDPISRLAELFTQFPGIGTRQARRFAYFILRSRPEYVRELTEMIERVRSSVRECGFCHRYFVPQKSGISGCQTCSDPERETTTLLIVEKDPDFDSIERSGAYQGQYFVLGGTLTILEKEPSSVIREKELLARIESLAPRGLKEIILAMSATPESEHTADYVRETLATLTQKHGIRVSVLGRGLSTGTELEYSDPDTLRHALLGRKYA